MNKSHAASRCLSLCLCLLFSYALLLSTIAPFGPRTVNAYRSQTLADKSELTFPSSKKTQAREGEVLVRFRAGASEQDKANVAAGHGSKRGRLRGESGVEKLDLPAGKSAQSAALELSQEPSVEFAEPNFLIKPDQISPSAEVVPNDARFSEQWSLRNTGQSGGRYGSDIGMPNGWHTSTGRQATVIAVIDSGIDFTHPDLANNEWTNPAPMNGDIHGWDYIADSATIKDEQGHGTAVAGIIAARGNNADGVSGVMWQASLMSLRVLDNTGTGDIASAVEATDYAVAHGAQVINLSWGTNNSSVALKSAIDRATKRGVVVVCSAGNDGQNIDATPYYPASFNSKDLISVAATGNTDQLASWSNWGYKTVTVAAPGSNILTTQIGGGYWSVTGTSVAAPLVTGVAGLMKSLRPSLTAAQVRSAIESNSRELSQLSSRVSSGGIVNAGAALSAVESNSSGNGTQGGSGNGNGNGNGNAYGQGDRQSTPGPYVPPGLRSDNNERRANGKEGLHAKPPASISGAPQANLPNLDESRKVRISPKTSATTTAIHSNMMLCADCGPGAGGGGGGSDPYVGTARSRPENETGDSGVKLGSRNFNWSLPLVGLKGRSGLDLSISLFYNSLVWTKQGSSIQYNADHGTPAPGFQMGLPRLQARYLNSDAGAYAYMMITPSGGRVEMKQVGSSSVYESSDNGYTQLTFSGSIPVVRTTDGTQYVFGTASAAEWRCTKIEDRNGNYISATYDATSGHVLTMTDTLGRTLNFGYDGDNNLYNITQTWGGVTHWWVVFIYAPLSMSYPFSGVTPVGVTNNPQTVLSFVALSDNTSYHFDYNSYGQVYQIRHKAPDGHELEHTWYNFDLSQAQTDCPRFTDKREYAQDWNNGQEAITYYSVTNGASWTTPETNATQTGTLVQQTAPDGTIYKEYSHSSGWDVGLGRLTEFWSGGVRKKYTSTSWTSDNTGVSYPLNPRVTEVSTYDDAGNRRRTTIEYNSGYSLPTHVRDYANDGTTVLRMTATAYKMDSVYIDKRIIGLPYERLVYDAATNYPVSRSIFMYDWADPYFSTQAPSTNYDSDNYPSSFIVGRGNLVAVFRYDCTNATTAYDDNLGIWSERYGYNMAGSMIWSQDAAGNRTNLSYADAFSVAGNNVRNTLAYVTQVTDPEGNASTAEYNYDFGAVTRTHVPTSGITPYRTFVDEVRTYDGYGRLDRVTNDTNHAYTRFVYDANANFVHTYQTLIDLTTANELHSWQVFDGAGRVRATAADHAGTTDHYDGQYVVYNNMGQVIQQSNPTEMTGNWTPGSWSPGGDDAAWRITEQAYDWKGRPTQTTNADGSTKVLSYGGCGCAGGEVTTMQDEHGRQRRLTKDTFGRLATVEELNWSGSVYATTNYGYNVRDQITQINQAGQIRSLAYDGHGRLKTRTTPEQGAINYSYNQDDTTAAVTDARGAKTVFSYNSRRLPTNISYDLSGVIAGQNVATTAGVSFGYDAAGHRTSMTDGMGSTTYGYNNLGQMTSETRNFNNVGSFGLSYGYNLAGELASITNPWGSVVTYSYDKAGRVNGVGGSGAVSNSNYASSITYRAFGGIKGMSFGDGKSLSTAYDNRLRPTTWNVSGVLGYNYNYDYFNEHTGRVTYAGSLNDPTLDRSYEYDNVGRLATSHSGTEARAAAYSGQWGTMDGPYSQGYDYDQWGNLTHKYGWGGEVQGGTAGQSSDIWYGYTNNRRNGLYYDASGNLTNDIGQAFTYDATGQQTASSYTNLQNFYDGDGLRVERTEDSLTPALFLRSTVLGGQIVAEIDYISGSWQWQRGYVYQGSQLLAVQQSGAVYWMHEDPVTKSKRVTDAGGNVVSTVETDPWGADTPRSSNAAFQPKKFTSYERDANGSDEAMFRRYNRWHSRFDQPDPYQGSYSLADPQSLNRYAYVEGDPVNLVDLSGLDKSDIDPGTGGKMPSFYVTVPISFDYPIDTSWGRALGFVNRLRPRPLDPPTKGGNNGGGDTGKAPPVDKGYGWWGLCNRSADDLMRTIRRDFSKFGNFAEAVAGGLGFAGIKFDSGPIQQGRTIGISVGAMSTIDPSISYSRSMSVTVSSASTSSFTFTTNPGHVFYPGTISFSANDTSSGVHFSISLKGELGDRQAKIGFGLGGGTFEDDSWNHFLSLVRESCGHAK